MPEGDTVHRWAGRLREAIAGRPLRRFEFRRDPRGVRPPAPGTVVEAVEARGKHLLVHFADGATLHTHMRIDGVRHVYRAGERWRRARYRARAVIEVDDGTQAVCFDAAIVELRRGGDDATAHLGPDLCADDVDLDDVLVRLDALAPGTEIGQARVTFAGGLAVYRKARRPCPRCRTAIRSAMTGDPPHVTYWCPTCQPQQ